MGQGSQQLVLPHQAIVPTVERVPGRTFGSSHLSPKQLDPCCGCAPGRLTTRYY